MPDSRPNPGGRTAEYGLLGAVVLAYCALQSWHFLTPGLASDETFDATLALDLLSNLAHPSAWPLRLVHYHTAIQSYFLAPFFLLIRNPAVALRTAEVSFGIAVLLATYFCVREFFNKAVALLTVILLTASPTFLYMSRFGVMMGSIMSAFALAALGLLLRWYRQGRQRPLLAAAFLLGVGSCVRIWFFWLPAALLVAAALHRKDLKPRLTSGCVWGGGLVFALGSAFRWVPEILAGFPATSYITSHFPRNEFIDNLAVPTNLAQRCHEFAACLAGIVEDPLWQMRQDLFLDCRLRMEWHLLILLLATILLLLWRKRPGPGQTFYARSRFFMVLLLVMFAFSIYAPIGLRQDHLFFLFPIPQILLALAAFCGYHFLASPKTGWPRLADAAAGAVFLSLLAAALLWHILIIYRTEDRLQRTGGEGFLSDATFSLSGWLEQHSIIHPKVCDWGIHDPVQFLSKGRIQPKKCWRILGRDNFITNCLDGDNIYLFLAPDEVGNDLWASQIFQERGERLTAEKTFYRRDGAVAFVAYARQPFAKNAGLDGAADVVKLQTETMGDPALDYRPASFRSAP